MAKPHIILTICSSVDGRADHINPENVKNRMDGERIQNMRAQVDAIVTSSLRIAQEDPEFTTSNPKKNPTIVIFDKHLEMPPKAKVLTNAPGRIYIVTCKKSQKNRVKSFQNTRSDVAIMESGEHAINVEDVLWELSRSGIRKMLLEGDDHFNLKMLDFGFVDELYILVAPIVLGGDYTPVFPDALDDKVHLKLIGSIQYGDGLLLHYEVSNNS